MGWQDIIGLAQTWIRCGGVAAVILVIGYDFFFRRKKAKLSYVLLHIVFVCYLILVFGVTLLNRFALTSSLWQGKAYPLFYAYKEAWQQFSFLQWRNIILNILLFVPLGFLLPMLFSSFQRAWKTYLIGFILTLAIETIQYWTKMGAFECDDILNNTLGTFVGYGWYRIFYWLTQKRRKESVEKNQWLAMIGCQIPALLAVTAFAALFYLHSKQELGNWSWSYVTPIESLTVSTDRTYSDEETMVRIYKSQVQTRAQMKEQAEAFFDKLGLVIDDSKTRNGVDESIYYTANKLNMLWIQRLGGTYEYTDMSGDAAEEDVSQQNKQEVREVLRKLDIVLPESGTFEEVQIGEYQFEVDDRQQDNWYLGSVRCVCRTDGTVIELTNTLRKLSFYKEMPMISEQEAYEKIVEGKFFCQQTQPLEVEVGEVGMEYILDTKGFYQPIYAFAATINGEKTQIYIAALRR